MMLKDTDKQISTHASTQEATTTKLQSYSTTTISTHASTQEATFTE